MHSNIQGLLTQSELAKRWGRTETAIGLASAVGIGPRHLNVNGQVMYPSHKVERFERACLFYEPADVALQELH